MWEQNQTSEMVDLLQGGWEKQSWSLVIDPDSSVLHWPELVILIYFSVLCPGTKIYYV